MNPFPEAANYYFAALAKVFILFCTCMNVQICTPFCNNSTVI